MRAGRSSAVHKRTGRLPNPIRTGVRSSLRRLHDATRTLTAALDGPLAVGRGAPAGRGAFFAVFQVVGIRDLIVVLATAAEAEGERTETEGRHHASKHRANLHIRPTSRPGLGRDAEEEPFWKHQLVRHW